MNRTSILMTGFLVLMVSIGCATSIKEYKPQSPDEEAIRTVLLTWEDSWNKGDVRRLLSVFHDNAEITYGWGSGKGIASKTEYEGIVSERMSAVPRVSMGLPSIQIAEAKAVVKTTLSDGRRSLPTTFHMVREDASWLVFKYDY
jgi:hypothetical protein